MITQDLIEVRYGNTSHIFTYFKETQNTLYVPSTAKITIYNSSRETILSETDMTIGSDGVCTYSWDSSSQDIAENYQVEYKLDSLEPVLRLFDIVKYPFINDVTDSDLFQEYKGFKDTDYEASGTSQSGTTTTLIDNNRAESNNHWKGGVIEIYSGQTIYIRKITGFTLSTGTITFTPALTSAVTTNQYTIRKSYQDDITYAGVDIQLHFKQMEKRAYLVLDKYILKRPVVYNFFKRYFFELIKEPGDEFDLKYQRYSTLYDTTLQAIKLVYDYDDNAIVDDDDKEQSPGIIRWYR